MWIESLSLQLPFIQGEDAVRGYLNRSTADVVTLERGKDDVCDLIYTASWLHLHLAFLLSDVPKKHEVAKCKNYQPGEQSGTSRINVGPFMN